MSSSVPESLIELGGYKKNELLAGRFMTDWAVHSVIDRNSWSRGSLSFMDSIFVQKKFWEDLTTEEQQRFAGILSLENGRVELMDVFRKAHYRRLHLAIRLDGVSF